MRCLIQIGTLSAAVVLSACGGGVTEVEQSASWAQLVALPLPANNEGYDYSSHHVDEVVVSADGSLIIAGGMRFNSNTSGLYPLLAMPYLTKLDANGNILWHQYYPGLGNWDTTIRDIELDEEGNIYLQDSDFVAKMDNTGTFLWEQIYLVEGAYELTLDGNRVISSGLDSHLIDAESGEIIRTLEGLGEFAYEVKVAGNGDLVRATPDGISRFTADGDLLWSVASPSHIGNNAGIGFVLDEGGNVYVGYAFYTTSSSSVLGLAPVDLMAINASGSVLWRKTIDDQRTSNQGKVTHVQMWLSGNELVLVGSDAQDRQVTLINKSNGSVSSELVAADAGFSQDGALSADGALYVTGWGQAQKFIRDSKTYTTFVGASDAFGALLGGDYYVVNDAEVNDLPVINVQVFSQ